jgi:predicted RNase H-like nuclease
VWEDSETSTEALSGSVFARFEELLAKLTDNAVVGVDIPIGLTERGSRACDLAARRFLGARRGASVFPAPLRGVLGATTHAEANVLQRAIEGKGLSIQAFGILPKVAEVDACLRSHISLTERVFEVHPEVAFAALNGNVGLKASKKTAQGQTVRLELLRPHFGDTPERFLVQRPRKSVAADDVLDAFAVLWSARRLQAGEGKSFPSPPDRDDCGLPMGIFF